MKQKLTITWDDESPEATRRIRFSPALNHNRFTKSVFRYIDHVSRSIRQTQGTRHDPELISG